jgi:hypothetical protein
VEFVRSIEEILDYARRAPRGEPVPITDAEVRMVAEHFIWSIRAITGGNCEIAGHLVVVL